MCPTTSDIGRRIQVIGNSCSGKSTLAEELASLDDAPFVELDALNWLPNWVGLNDENPDQFRLNIREATSGDAWVVAGSYMSFSQETFWARLQTLIWLDLPRWQLLLRVMRRSWRRARSNELLWGSNYERFWPQLKFWNRDSLVWWIWTQHARKRHKMLAISQDPQWAHIRVIRLTSTREISAFRHDLAESKLGKTPGTAHRQAK